MCHEERGDSDLQLHSTDLVAQSSSDFRIEGRQWLVQKQNLWLDGERSGQGDTLLLTTRKLVGEPIGEAAEPDELEHFARPLAPLAGAHLAHLQPEGHVLPGRHVRKQRIRLEHHADITLVGRLPGDVLTADDHPSAVGLLETRDQPERRRFATAGGPEQGDQLAGSHRQTQAVERGHSCVATPEVLEPNLDPSARGGPQPGGRDRTRHLRPPPAAPGNGRPARS